MCESSQPPLVQNQPEDVTHHDIPCTAAARTGPRLRGGSRPCQRRAQIEDNRGLSRVPCREAAVTTPAGPQEADGPNIARVYDYLLGGSHNFDADRVAAAEFPGVEKGRPVDERYEIGKGNPCSVLRVP